MLITRNLILLTLLFATVANAQSNKLRIDEGIVRISVHQRGQEFKSGYGAFISKDGEFITSRSLVNDAIQSPHYYTVKVFNKDGTKLSNLKLSKCGFEMEMDVCLMKVDYSSLFWFDFGRDKLKQEQKLQTIENDKKIKYLDAIYASTQLNNFTSNLILRTPPDREVPRGAPVYDKNGKLYGITVTYGGDRVSKEITHAIPVSELELFVLMNKFFYPLKRSKDTNFFLSNLEKMLREKKALPGGSMTDLRKLRRMEQKVQCFWPYYRANADAQGVQELKRLYELAEKIGESTKFRSSDDFTKEENAKRLMERKKGMQEQVAKSRQKLQELEMKLEKDGIKSSSVTKNKIRELEAEKAELERKNKEARELIKKRKSELEGVLDEKTKDLIFKGLEITEENIKENNKRINECNGQISKLKLNNKGGDTRSENEIEYEREARGLHILEERMKELDQRAYEFFEDAI